MNILKQLTVFFLLALAVGLVALAGMAYFEGSQASARHDLARLEVAAAQQRAQLDSAAVAQSAGLAMERERALAGLYTGLAAFWAVVPAALAALLLAGLAGGLGAGLDAYRLRRVPLARPDERGLVPVARRALEVEPGHALALLAAYHQGQLMRASQPARLLAGGAAGGQALEVDQQAGPAMPSAPAFASLWADGFRPTMQRLCLGYGAGGPVYGTIDDLLSTLVVGRPGTGKTTALRFLLAQLVACGAELAILDPHGALADDCEGLPATWRAESSRELDRVSAALCRELDKRLAARQAGEREFPPLLLLVDEWNILSEVCKPAVEVARRYILEARKVRGYALISGQGAPAASFGGSVARDGLSSRLILWTTAQQARMAGLEADSARALLPILASNPRGHGILARSSHEPEIIAIPNTLPSDITNCQLMVSRAEKQAGNHRGNHAETIIDLPARETIAETMPETTDPRAQQVRAMVKEGSSHAEIIKALWGAESGRKYQDAKRELESIIAGLV